MPRRNLSLIVVLSAVSLVCHWKVQRSRFSGPFGEALAYIQQRYVEPTDARALYEAAMHGMVGKLDENSAYLNPIRNRQLEQETFEPHIEGIGIAPELDPETKELRVAGVYPDTPALNAGILTGDRIQKIDGQPTKGLTLDDAASRIRGPVDEPVVLTVLHPGASEPVDITIVRQKIDLDSVVGDRRGSDGKFIHALERNPRIKYIRVKVFSKQTVTELTEALAGCGDIEALILDLRFDGGGLLTQAVEVCDLFVDAGTIVSVRSRHDGIKEHRATGDGAYRGFPLVLLVNGQSASASEIVAACLQDHQRALVVGEQSYGKGTVQHVLPLEGGKASLKLTTAYFIRPSGNNIHRTKRNENDKTAWGVRPNPGYEVILSEEDRVKLYRHQSLRERYLGNSNGQPTGAKSPEDIAAEKYVDPQLAKGVEYLQTKLRQKDAAEKEAAKRE